jgi:SAM-dependent methyltransferase
MWRENLIAWKSEGTEAHYGDQWGDPETVDMLKRVRDRFITPHVVSSKTALEIGSGGGRWTQYLLGFDRVYCVDINREMFHYMIERFGGAPQLSFCETDGQSFPGVPRRSVDFVFTFGTFVHLDPLAPGAQVVVQYADKAKPLAAGNEGFAHTTRPLMLEMLTRCGYEVLEEDNESLPHSNVVRFRAAI